MNGKAHQGGMSKWIVLWRSVQEMASDRRWLIDSTIGIIKDFFFNYGKR